MQKQDYYNEFFELGQQKINFSSSQTHECAPQPHHILNSKIIKT